MTVVIGLSATIADVGVKASADLRVCSVEDITEALIG
jgi:hypothetical protein